MDSEREIQKCIDICRKLQIEMENDSQLSCNYLGGEMISIYEELRKCQQTVIKRICSQLYDLKM